MIDSIHLEQILTQKSGISQTELQLASKKYPYCALLRWLDKDTDMAALSVMIPYRQQLYAQYKLHSRPQAEEKSGAADVCNCKNAPVPAAAEETTPAETTSDALDILQQRLQDLHAAADARGEEESVAEERENEEIVLDSKLSLDELIERYNTMPPPRSRMPLSEDDVYENDFVHYKDYGKSSLQEKTNIVSETLAKLYEDQGAYDRALKIYEVLSKNNPEKNDIFAIRIEEIKVKKNKIK